MITGMLHMVDWLLEQLSVCEVSVLELIAIGRGISSPALDGIEAKTPPAE